MIEITAGSAQLADANWYRAHYALSAQCLQVATLEARLGVNGDEFGWPQGMSPKGKVWRKRFGAETQQLLLDLHRDRASAGDHLVKPAVAAAREAEELARCAAGVLDEAGWHWVGRRPPRYLRWFRGRSRLRWRKRVDLELTPFSFLQRRRVPGADLELARFLNSVVEPAAVVLFLSARLTEHRKGYLKVMAAMPRDLSSPFQPLDRCHGVSEEWFFEYLAGLVTDGRVVTTRRARLAAWLGRTRLRAPESLGFRARYDLACLFSRVVEAALDEGDAETAATAAKIAANQLDRSLRGLSDDDRAPLAEWAGTDPGLYGLQIHKRREFAAIVAKWHPHGRKRQEKVIADKRGEKAIADSEVLRRIAYDGARMSLEVEFLDGSRYEYLGVPAEIYEQFPAVPGVDDAPDSTASPGKFFNERVKGKYSTIRLQ